VLSDLYNNLPEDFKCDLIVSNPPYVLQEEFATLSPQVRLWEDKNALVPAPGWHEFYGRILSGAKQFLRPSDNLNFIEQKRIPKIVLEIGPAQNGIRSFINNYNFSYCEVFKDICGKLRWVAIYV
jgi:release factor glutamine methyltransferase